MKKLDTKTGTTTYFCDRCTQKFAESKPFEKAGNNDMSRGVTIPLPVVTNGKVDFESKELCGTCVYSLDQWMREGDKPCFRKASTPSSHKGSRTSKR